MDTKISQEADFNYGENAAVCDEAREVAASFSRMLGWKPVDAYNAILQGVAIAKKRPINKAAPEYKWAFEALIDAHYGLSYHHIGDGDGIPKEEADRIRKLISTSKQDCV